MLRSSISSTLKKHFKYVNIYHELIESPKLPAFIIHDVNTEITKSIGRYYRKKHMYKVTYIPKEELQSERYKLSQIGTELLFVLENVEFKGERYRGYKIEYKIVDDLLHLFVVYSSRNVFVEEKTAMENIERSIKKY